MKNILAIDIGGTFIKSALYTNNQLGKVTETPTPLDSFDSLKKTLQKIVENYSDLSGIAMAMPGFIDVENGIARTGGYLKYIDNHAIVKELSELFKLPVTVENDAKAAMLAELSEGSLRNTDNAVMLVFGTAIGGAIAIDKKIVKGNQLLAGEFSYVSANIGGIGNRKESLGYLLGAAGLSTCVEETSGLKGLNGRQIFKEILDNGNEEVRKGLRIFCRRIAWFIYNLEAILDPQLYAIGGGISRQPLFIEMIREEIDALKDQEPFCILEKPNVVACAFLSEANLIGAVHNFLNRYSNVTS